jgi:hypothetical protein
LANAIRQLWPLLAAGLGVGIGFLLWRAPGGPTILRFLPPVGVALLTVLCFRDWFRQDRIGFISVIGPAFLVAVASTLSAPPWWSLTGAIPILFLALFIFDSPARPWWWQHILRRPLPTIGQRFDYHVGVELRAWMKAVRRADGAEVIGAARVASARAALARLHDLVPPDDVWAAIRDEYVDVGERWVLVASGDLPAEEATQLQAQLDDLKERRRELRERT